MKSEGSHYKHMVTQLIAVSSQVTLVISLVVVCHAAVQLPNQLPGALNGASKNKMAVAVFIVCFSVSKRKVWSIKYVLCEA